MAVLGEWIDSGDAVMVEAAASLLREAPASFVFDQFDFVANALTKAHSLGDVCHRAVASHLRASAVEHVRSRQGAGAFPQDEQLRDSADEAAGRARPGTPVRQFFEELSQTAGENIRQTHLQDEEVGV